MSDLSAADVLVVDVDGTLTPANTLKLLRLRYFLRRPFGYAKVRQMRGISKQAEKVFLWEEVPFSRNPPINSAVVELVNDWTLRGGVVHVVSGSATGLAEFVSHAAGISASIDGSDRSRNLTKGAKAAFVKSLYVAATISYIGDSSDDLPVWRVCDYALCVGWTADELNLITTRSGEYPRVLPTVEGIGWRLKAAALVLF